MKKSRVLGFILFLITSPFCFASTPPVKIGIITDLSGKASYLGEKTRIGAQICRSRLLAEGHEIELVFGDSAFDAAKAVSEVHKLIEIDHVDAIYSNFSPIAVAIAPVVKSSGKLWVYTGAAMSPVTSNGSAFKSYLDYRQGCRAIVSAWQERGLRTIGILKPISEFGDLCAAGAASFGGIIKTFDYALGDEVKTQVLKLKAEGVEAILNATYEGDFLNMLKALFQLQYRVPLGAEDTSFTPKAQSQYGTLVDEIIFYGMPTPASWFIDEVKKYDRDNALSGIEHAGMAYLHIRQLYTAIAACQRGDVACPVEKLKSAAPEPDFGFLSWDDEHIAVFNWAVKSWHPK